MIIAPMLLHLALIKKGLRPVKGIEEKFRIFYTLP